MEEKCISGRTNPELWEQAKASAKAKLGEKHSARAMQLAGKIYRGLGGEYCNPKTKSQMSLTKWTSERWQVAPNAKSKKACRADGRCDRYLPEAAWYLLTPNQIKATRYKKLNGKTQFIGNTKVAKETASRARKNLANNLDRESNE